jgi:hypothetical protein
MLTIIGQQVVTVFLPVQLAILIAFLCGDLPRQGGWPWRFAYYVIATAIILLLMHLMGSTVGVGLVDLAMNGTNGRSNMDLLLSENSSDFSVVPFVKKIISSYMHFVRISATQIFFLPFLALVFANLFFLRSLLHSQDQRSRPHIRLMAYVFAVSIGVYIIVITVHQNQARYTLYALPVVIMTAAKFYEKSLLALVTKHLKILVGLGIVMFAVGAHLSIILRAESATAAAELAALQSVVQREQAFRDTKVAIDCYREAESLQLAYAFPEMLFVHMRPEAARSQMLRIVEISGAKLLVCPTDWMPLIRQQSKVEIKRLFTLPGKLPLEVSEIQR